MEAEELGTEATETTETPAPQQGAEQPPEPQGAQADEETPAPQQGAEQEKPKGKDFQSRINRLVWESHEKERQLAEAQQKLQEFERRTQERSAATDSASAKQPKVEDFEDWNQYLAARDQYNRETILSELREEREQENARQKEQAAVQAQQRRLYEAETQFRKEEQAFLEGLGPRAEQYNQRAEQLAGYLLGQDGKLARPDIATALFEAGPVVVDHMGSHLDEFAALVEADPITAGITLGRLAAQLGDRGRQGAKYRTPPPEKTLGGSSAAASRELSELSEKEFMARRMKELGIKQA